MNCNTALSFCILAVASSASWAQQPLSLQEAEARVSSRNRQVLEARAAVQIRKEEAAVTRTRRLPALGTSIEAGPLLNKASVTFPAGSLGSYGATGPLPGSDARIGIPRQISGYSVAQFSLPLLQQPRLGLGIRAADLEARSAGAQAEAVTQRAVAQVRSLYFQILALEGARTTVAGQVTVAEEVVRLARKSVEEGTSLPAELAEAEARRTRARTTAANLASDIENQCEQLNLALGEPVETRFRLEARLPTLDGTSLEEARARSVANRPEIREAELRERQAELAIRAKRLEWLPDVDLKVTHYSFINAGNLAPGQVAIAALSLSWEPWDWGRKSHETSAARQKAEQARLAVVQAKAQAAAEAGRAWREWERAQREQSAARQEVNSTAESLRVARQRFENQSALLRAVLEAQSAWEAAGQRAVEAAAASGVAWANLQLATGASI
jgi:outer membrane protein TolC